MENTLITNKKNLSFSDLLKASWKHGSFLYIFIVMFAIYAVVNADYISWGSITNILTHTAVIGTLSLGMGLIIVSGDIDLSVGANFAFSGGMGILVYKEVFERTNHLTATFVSMIVIIAIAALIGFINGVMVGKFKMPAFIATLGTMLIFRSLCKYILKAIPTSNGQQQQTYQLIDYYKSPYFDIGTGSFLTLPIVGIIFILFVLLVWYIAKYTKFGRKIFALGSNSKAATLSGINVPWTKAAIFALAGALIGVSAILHISVYSSMDSSTAGMSYELYAIASCVIGGISMNGGRGNIIGILFGALSFQIIDKIISALNLNPLINDTIKGAILLVAIILQLIVFNKKAIVQFLRKIKVLYNPEEQYILEATLRKKVNNIKLAYDKKMNKLFNKQLEQKELDNLINSLLDEREVKIVALNKKYELLIDNAKIKYSVYCRNQDIKTAENELKINVNNKNKSNKETLKLTIKENKPYQKEILTKANELETELYNVQKEGYGKVDELVLDVSLLISNAEHVRDRDLQFKDKQTVLNKYKNEIAKIEANLEKYKVKQQQRNNALDSKYEALIEKNNHLIEDNAQLEEKQIIERDNRLAILKQKELIKEEKKNTKLAAKQAKIDAKLENENSIKALKKQREDYINSILKSRNMN